MASGDPHSVQKISERLLSSTQACVRCGLCQPHCPTYLIDRHESESPRGRITLAAALAQDRLADAFDSAALALEHCLGCRRCEQVCPAGVRFDALIVDARALVRRRQAPAWRQRALEWAIVQRWPLRVGFALLRALQRLLPTRWLGELPVVPRQGPTAGLHPPIGAGRGRVALFTGCVAQRLDADIHRAAIKVLNRLGWEVWLPPGPLCCGALHRHAGALDAAAGQSDVARSALREVAGSCSAILVAASGCHADLRDAVADLPAPVHELLAFVADDVNLASLALRNATARVALHTPCTQSSGVHRPDAAAAVLGRIPGLRIEQLSDSGCCGAAGSHALLQRERAGRLRDLQLEPLTRNPADVLCSSNVGCRLHLASGLNARGATVSVLHPLELLAEHLA